MMNVLSVTILLTVNVNRLRKKLEEINLGRYIETKVGQGYIAIEEENRND